MKQPVFTRILIAFFSLVLVSSCESRKPENVTQPKEFEPDTEVSAETSPDKTAVAVDSALDQESAISAPERKPMPTAEELKEITPDQKAGRALNNDAMKAAGMKPEEFIAYMKTRIPYYRGKGNLKAENDLVRVRIDKTEMKIETVKGSQTFPMQ
jgi:hypothetical protein